MSLPRVAHIREVSWPVILENVILITLSHPLNLTLLPILALPLAIAFATICH